MEESSSFFEFVWQQKSQLFNQTAAHIGLTLISLLIALVIALPLGILISRNQRLSAPVLGMAGILQTIPSIALLGVMIPLFGIGPKPAVIALFLYALLPIIRNTYAGISEVDSSVKDAAKGMGLSKKQILFKVELPLAFPVIMAGIRTATVINVGVATLAAYIAAGGLGEFIFGGIALNNSNMILAGAIPSALLAILLDFLLSLVQKVNFKNIRVAFLFIPFMVLLLSSFYLLPSKIGGKMLAGFTPEFMGRNDGFLGLQKAYGLNLETVVISDAMKYQAIYEQKLDVIDGYSTDGRLKAFDLITLKDDKHIFPPYGAAPLVRQETLNKYPELAGILNQLSGLINDSVMTALNYNVDKLKLSPEQVAADFLRSKHLLKPDRRGNSGIVRIGSKVFGEQYILAQLYKFLIQGFSTLQVETKTGLGGTKICFDALVNKQIDLYPEYTGTGFLVILKPSTKVISDLSSDGEAVYEYVKREFEQQYQLSWLKPIGFNNSYALMMRRSQAEQLKITSISELTTYINQQ